MIKFKDIEIGKYYNVYFAELKEHYKSLVYAKSIDIGGYGDLQASIYVQLSSDLSRTILSIIDENATKAYSLNELDFPLIEVSCE